MDAVAIDHRVAGDRRRDHGAHAEPSEAPAEPASHEQHAGGDREHPADLSHRRPAERHQHREHQCEHGREPPGDGVDDAQLETPVGRREQADIGQLERSRARDERDGRTLDAPGRRGRHDQHDHEGGNGDRRRRLRVRLAGEQEVPERVQGRGPER